MCHPLVSALAFMIIAFSIAVLVDLADDYGPRIMAALKRRRHG